ncbi:MAG: hypothetical protein AB7O96_08355 [Pseudobdellovibrionaceae bacterium]
MSYSVRSFCSDEVDTSLLRDLEVFCMEAEKENRLRSRNWQYTDWSKKPETFLYCLMKEKRFSQRNGEVTAVYDDLRIVAVSGVYESEFAPETVAIGGVRAHTLQSERKTSTQKGYGFLHGDYIFPKQILWAEKRGFTTFALTFNKHNRWLAEFILRIGQKKAIGLGYHPQEAAQKAYSGFSLWPHMVIIKATPQFLLHKNLKPEVDCSFDFSRLEARGQT